MFLFRAAVDYIKSKTKEFNIYGQKRQDLAKIPVLQRTVPDTKINERFIT